MNIATKAAVINSAESFSKYSKNKISCEIINFFGEFDAYKEQLNLHNINLIDHYDKKIMNLLPKKGKILSRVSFFIIFAFSFFPLKKLLKKKKPNFLIIHLITSLPLILLILFKFETKFILRISGTPKLGFFRRLLWKIALKKIYLVTCPTINSLEFLNKSNLVERNKIKLLFDPIIKVENASYKKKQENFTTKNYNYLSAAGRLTGQKNFILLCKAFKIISKKYPNIKLVIAGDGEDKEKILSFIKKNNLCDQIYLIGHLKNIYSFFYNSIGFILPSLWEDPGFVIIEAAYCRTPIISSSFNENGNKIIINGHNGFLFKNNNVESLAYTMDEFLEKKINVKKISYEALKMTRQYTLFRHYQSFNRLLLN